MCVVLALAFAGSALADDAFPPCWRGKAGTTYQDWSFAEANNPAAPDAATNANGTAQATLVVGAFGTGWNGVSLGNRTGVWDLGRAGRATVVVPNFGGSPAWKYLQLQVTYFDAPGFYLPPVVSIAGATLVSSQVVVSQPAAPGNWKTYQSVWLLRPSPGSETIVLAGDSSKGLLLDEIIVDTRCAAAGDGDVPAYRPCWRGQPGTTFQQWLFGVSNNPASIPAELVANPFGAPAATLVPGAASSGYTQENPALGCRQGIWDLGQRGALTLSIPNPVSSSGGAFQYLRLQVTQYRDAVHNANATVAIAGGTLVSQQEQTLETTAAGGQWVVAQTVWRLGPPGPASASVVLTAGPNGALLDQVVVDTACLDLACPSNIVASTDPGQCSKGSVTWALPAVDGCLVTNVTSVPANGSSFPVGTNLVATLISDGEGGTTTCSFMVTVSPAANVSVGITSSTSPATLGSNLTYTVTVSNGGPCMATGLVLSNYLSAGQIGLAVTNGQAGIGQACPFPGPAAWWPAEGDASDAAGGNQGTVSGGVTYRGGEVGQAFGFDGLTGSVSVPDAPSLRPSSLTLEGWVKPHTVTGVRVLIGKRVGSGATDSYSLWIDSGILFAGIADSAGFGPLLSCPAPLEQWAHVAFSFDAASQSQALYVNGTLVNASLVNKTIAYDAHPVLLGADDNQGVPGFFYLGEMDELTLYSRALTGSEIQAIYRAGAGGKCRTPGVVPLADLAGGASAQVSLVTVPTNCQPLSLSASLSAPTPDPNPANNTATVSVAVQALPLSDLLLSIQPVSGNNNLLRLSWPLTCTAAELQAAGSVQAPMPWGSAAVPVLLLEGRHCAIVPASEEMRYFRVRVP